MKTVLFLCTGNYYRSRFAEVLFNSLAARRGAAWRAESRGLDPSSENVGAISTHTLDALGRLAIPLGGPPRFPIRVTEADFSAADSIVAIKEAEHRVMIERLFPAWGHRIEYWHVDDLDCAGPDEAIPQLEREVAALLERLSGGSS